MPGPSPDLNLQQPSGEAIGVAVGGNAPGDAFIQAECLAIQGLTEGLEILLLQATAQRVAPIATQEAIGWQRVESYIAGESIFQGL